MVISASLQACGVVFPFAMPTSICRSIVTICSGLYLLIGMTRFSSKWILSHSTWYKFCRSRQRHRLHSLGLLEVMIYGCDKRAAQHQRIKVWTEGPDLQKPDRLRAGHFLWSSLRAKVAELRRFCRDFQGNATGLLYNPDCVANLRCSALQDLMISSPSCTLMSVRREVCERKRHLTNNKAVSVISIA